MLRIPPYGPAGYRVQVAAGQSAQASDRDTTLAGVRLRHHRERAGWLPAGEAPAAAWSHRDRGAVRPSNNLSQRLGVGLIHPPEIQTGLAGLVRPEPGQQVLVFR